MCVKFNESGTLPEININSGLAKITTKIINYFLLIIVILVALSIMVICTFSINNSVDANGSIEQISSLEVHSTGSGIVKKIFIMSGDTVQIGQKLITIDSLSLYNKLLDLKSEYKSKLQTLNKSIKLFELTRIKNRFKEDELNARLLKSKASFREKLPSYFHNINPDSLLNNYKTGTHVSLDYAVAEIYSTEAEIKILAVEMKADALEQLEISILKIDIEKLKAEIEIMQEEMSNLSIYSSCNGVVTTENVEKLLGTTINEGQYLFEIAPLDKWKAYLYVKEIDLPKIEIGDQVRIEINALKNIEKYKPVYGNISEISEEPYNGQNNNLNSSNVYRVTALIEARGINPYKSYILRKGYSVQANIITDSDKIINILLRKIFAKIN